MGGDHGLAVSHPEDVVVHLQLVAVHALEGRGAVFGDLGLLRLELGAELVRLGFEFLELRAQLGEPFFRLLELGAEEARCLTSWRRADRVLQLADRLRLDLADALAGDLEDPADLLEGVGVAVADAVAELDDLALAEGQRV
jgi:hypothetical protein